MSSYFSVHTPSPLSGDGSDARCQRLYQFGTPEALPSLSPLRGLLGDRYRILKLLGQGGFGKTFLAADEQMGRKH